MKAPMRYSLFAGLAIPRWNFFRESVERYLKGFLVGQGWKLERIHDLNRLVDLASRHDSRFTDFASLAQSLTEQICAQHYPGGDLTDVGADYEALRKTAGDLIDLIPKLVSPNPPQ